MIVPTTLKEFYNGCVKTINYSKQTVALDGKTLEQTACNKAIEIKMGMDMHCNQMFVGEGHQQPGQRSSNLYVNFQPMPPNATSNDFEVTRRYQRIKNDLIYRHKITLQEAIQCKPVKIPLLDGGQALLAIDEVIQPKTMKVIEGQGMKVYKRDDHMDEKPERGDLFVIFEIEFPKKLNSSQRD